MEKNIYQKIKELQSQYIEMLLKKNAYAIQGALEIIEDCKDKVSMRERVKLDTEVSKIDDNSIKEIFILLKDFQNNIKEIFVENSQTLTHTTDKSPQEITNETFKPSKLIFNHYEVERGDYFFASSAKVDGNNLYIARNAKTGMIVRNNICIYGSDVFKTGKDNKGVKRLLLKNPNYIYELDPQNFSPVVILKEDKNGLPYFDFSEEWVTEETININDKSKVKSIKKIEDVTGILFNYQIFTDTTENGEAIKILNSKNKEEMKSKFLDSLRSERLKYINSIYGINVDSRFAVKDEKDEFIR